jgi:hypothetical protein
MRVLGDGRFLTIRRLLAPDLSPEAEDLGRRGELDRRTRDFVDAPGMYELPRINLAWLYSRCNPLWGWPASETARKAHEQMAECEGWQYMKQGRDLLQNRVIYQIFSRIRSKINQELERCGSESPVNTEDTGEALPVSSIATMG